MSQTDQWLGVEARHLAALEAVAGERSFAGAARKLGYTQSAISLQIAALERIAGHRLLERSVGRQPVTPTPAGERVLRHARRLLEQLKTTETDLVALAAGQAGTLTLGTFESTSVRLLPSALRRLRADRPHLEIRFDETPYVDQPRRLAAGKTDACFVLLPVDGPFTTCELLCDPFMFITARRASGPADELPSLAQLARIELISWQSGPFCLEALLRSKGHEPDVVFRSDHSSAVQSLVAAGLGSAVLPRLALNLPDRRLHAIDATPHLPPRRIGLAWHQDRDPGPALHALIQALEAGCAEHEKQHKQGGKRRSRQTSTASSA